MNSREFRQHRSAPATGGRRSSEETAYRRDCEARQEAQESLEGQPAPNRLISPKALAYVQHVTTGTDLFNAICEQDMEGIVAKAASVKYTPDATTWVKIKNKRYSQAVGTISLTGEKFKQRGRQRLTRVSGTGPSLIERRDW